MNHNLLKGKPNILSIDTVSMPSVLSRVAELERKFLKNAPKKNQPKIEKVLAMYKDKANMNFTVVQNMVLALYSPSLFEKKEKVDKMYENFLSKYQNEEAFPTDYKRGMTNKQNPRTGAEVFAEGYSLHSGDETTTKGRG